MKKILLILAVFSCTCLLISCNSDKSNKTLMDDEAPKVYPKSIKEKSADKTSGAREAMAMDFEMTKDVKLGYVPAERLVKAANNALLARRSGIASRVSALNWIERGPTTNSVGQSNGNIRGPSNDAVTSGRMRAIWVDLADATNQTVWVGSVSGGLWKTNNITTNPANWALINDFLGNLAVTSICQDPTNTNIMYFGTGEKTFNVDAVRGGGIWKSTDHGVTWNLLPNTTSFWNVSRVLCDAAGNVYVATIGNFGIQRSVDGGASWTSITPSGLTTRVTEMRISSTGRMHIVCGYRNSGTSGYRYTDNPSAVTSSTWTEPDPSNTFPTAYNTELAVAGNVLYALPSNSSYTTPTIYKSTDGGANWAATATSPPSGSAPETINTNQAWFDLAIGVDPADPNVVIAGGLNFYRSINGGASWSQITRWVGNTINYVHADHHAVVWNGTQVLLATDGGIFYSIDNGSSFADRNVGLRTKQFYSCAIHPTTTNYFLGGTQDNGTHQFNSAGLGASIEVLGGDGGFVHIDENEPQFQFGATVYSNYRRSTNGGANWSSVNYSSSIGSFINPTDYDDINNKMYTSAGTGGAGSFVRWENPQNGSTFNSVPITDGTSAAVTSVKVSRYTNNRVFFGSADGRVVKVDNAHLIPATVTNISGSNIPANNTVSCVEIGTSDNHLIATISNYGAGGNVFVSSTGGGASGWTDITGDLPDVPVRWGMFFPEDDDKAIIATEMGIFETDDINGASTVWVQNTSFPVVRTNMLQYRQRDGTLLAATHGRGMWTTSLPSTVPYIRYSSSYAFSAGTEATTATVDGCRNYKDYTVNLRIDQAPTGNATATFSVTGGTAEQGVDFDFTTNGNFTTASNTLTFPNGSTAEQSITIRVYNDAEIESSESFMLTYNVSGTTNAMASPSSQSYTFTINDDDVAPVVAGPGEVTVGSGNYGNYIQPFRGSFAKSRSQYVYTAAELTAAGVKPGELTSIGFDVTSKGSTIPFTGLTVSLKNTSSTTLSGSFEAGATVCYTGTYSTFLGVNTLTFNGSPFVWDGVSNLLVEICYNNTDGVATGDDNVATNSTVDQKGIWARAASGTAGCSITTGLFGSASGTFIRPNIILPTIVGNAIETVVNVGKQENITGNGTYYFYTPVTNKVISRITGASASLGCVTSNLSAAGNSWQSFFAGQRSQKVVDITFSGNPTATYTLGLYFTAAELSGKTPGTLKIAGTTAASVAGADNNNSTVYTTNFVSFGSGYLFTATVSGAAKYFLAEENVTSIRNPSLQANIVKLLQNPVSTVIPINISNQSRVNIEATLFTNNGQMLKRWSLGRAEGNRQLSLSGGGLPAGSYILRIDAGTKTQTIKLVKQ